MTDREWAGIVAVLTANWPHQLPPDLALDKWRGDLDDLDGQLVLGGVEAIYRDGRDFPPNGAQMRAKALELEAGPQRDWSEGYKLANNPGKLPEGKGRASYIYNAAETLAHLETLDPVAAETVRRLGVNAWAERLATDETTWRAQFRDVYRQVADRADRERRYAGLPLPRTGEGLRPAAGVFAAIAKEAP